MVISIGADHGGYKLKEKIKKVFGGEHKFVDVGAKKLDPKDSYVGYSLSVGEMVQNGTADYGIMICRTGVGAVIALNKLVGIRAGVLESTQGVTLARKKNNINCLSFGADNVTEEEAIKIVELFLSTEFEGGRHKLRLEEISDYENKHIK